MLSELFLERRYRRGKARGRAEGRSEGFAVGWAEGWAEGFAAGKEQGRAKGHWVWSEWNNRRLAAEAEGRPFDEPPPSPPNGDSNRG